MKAWIVWNKDGCGATVVFAKTRGKARYLAQKTDTCEDMKFIEINPKRIPEADCMYRGVYEMDYHNEKDHDFMISHGWWCEICKNKDNCETYNHDKTVIDSLENEE